MAVSKSLRRALEFLRAAGAALSVLAALAFSEGASCAASPEEAVARHLDRWSAIRWGSDCVVWLVHYPEEMVPAWVKLESKRRRFSPKDASAYEKSFREQLRMATSRPFLLTVQVFGSPLKLGPIKENLSMRANGRVFKPSAYDRRLDQPISGLVQGLVFFPKEATPPYRIQLKGLLPSTVTVDLPAAPGAVDVAAPSPKPLEPSSRSAGPPKGRQKDEVGKAEVKAQGAQLAERPKAETPSVPPKPKKGEVKPTPEPKIPRAPGTEPEPPKAVKAAEQPNVSQDVPEQPKVQAPKKEETQKDDRRAREEAIRAFLDAWRRDDLEAAWGMMSSRSRSQGKEQLISRLGSHSFRWALKEGYKVSLEGDAARVSATQRFLMVKMMKTETFRLVEEGGRYRVDWQ
ncbi:MAG: hypothetical protein N2315_06345 [Thermanaerothrix sp.]|nr:hypothetical protein [Thermanaerothrix sp.]